MKKTAVLIIHGVGEQAPMGTVRSFVRLFAGEHFRSKPDREGESFELRRLSTYASDDDIQARTDARNDTSELYPPNTVFYEYYWAFHYRDTETGLVARWLWGTIKGLWHSRQLSAVRGPVLRVLTMWIALLIVGVGLFIWGVIDLAIWREASFWTMLKLVGGPLVSALVWVGRPILIGWVGDAARYFGNSPMNPVERQQIRAEGIKILKRLHEQKVNNRANPDAPPIYEYDRIIVVGHSLGSVVAYDMLTHFWAGLNQGLQIPRDNDELKAARELGEKGKPTAEPGQWTSPSGDNRSAEAWQKLQTDLVNAAAKGQKAADEAAAIKASSEKSAADLPPANQAAQKAVADRAYKEALSPHLKNVHQWRITDLVTLGCPLTYARFLMADSAEDLANRQLQREMPTCPPTIDKYKDKQGLKSFVFYYSAVVPQDHLVPNHAAPFLLTRWTNIYHSQDPIGGPVAPIFGWGIRDIEVNYTCTTDSNRPEPDRRTFFEVLADLFGAAHVRYWDLRANEQTRTPDSQIPLVPRCAKELQRIVMGGRPPLDLSQQQQDHQNQQNQA